MRVVLLGTGTAIPVKDRGYAGLYVRVAGEHVVLDAGPGTLRQLAHLGLTYRDLDRIFLTHFHPDHCLDLVSILFAMRIPQPAVGSPSAADTSGATTIGVVEECRTQGRSASVARTVPPRSRAKPLVIYGPRGLRQLYRRLNAAFQGWIAPRTYRLILRELGETTLRLRGYTVTTRRMAHAEGRALGYRIQTGGRAIAYSGDTDACRAIVELGRRADLLILECSMTDERKVLGHLTPSDCGRVAAEAGCRHLLLTHFYPVFRGYDIRGRVRRAFRGRLTLARDFQQLTV